MQNLNLSTEALKILKSFSGINSGMVFKPGHKFEVAHPLKTVIGICDAGVAIPVKFAVYDMSKLLGVVGLHDKNSVEFNANEAVLVIKSKSGNTKYRLTDPTNVTHLPDNFKLDMSKETGRFDLRQTELEEIKTVANSLGLPHVVFGCDPTHHLTIDVKDVKNDSSDEHDIHSESAATGDFEPIVFKTENLSLLLPNDYKVVLTSKVAHFVSTDGKLEYYVAVEPK